MRQLPCVENGDQEQEDLVAALSHQMSFRRSARILSERFAQAHGHDADDLHQMFWLQLCVLQERQRWPFGRHRHELKRRLAAGRLGGVSAIVIREAVRQLARLRRREHHLDETTLAVGPHSRDEEAITRLAGFGRRIESAKQRLALAQRIVEEADQGLDLDRRHVAVSLGIAPQELDARQRERQRLRTELEAYPEAVQRAARELVERGDLPPSERRDLCRRQAVDPVAAERCAAVLSAWRRSQTVYYTNLCRARARLAAG